MQWHVRYPVFLFLVMLLVAGAGAIMVTVQVGESIPVGGTGMVRVVLDQAPEGISGFNISITMSDPARAEIIGVQPPAWASLNMSSPLPAGSMWLKAVDLMKKVEKGATNVELATLSIEGVKEGSVTVTVEIQAMDDDSGNVVSAATQPAVLRVGAALPGGGTPTPTPSSNVTETAAPPSPPPTTTTFTAPTTIVTTSAPVTSPPASPAPTTPSTTVPTSTLVPGGVGTTAPGFGVILGCMALAIVGALFLRRT